LIDLIREKKATYGSNFEAIAKSWCKIICLELSPEDVAEMMALMKECRIKAIKEKLNGDAMLSTAQAQELKAALEDSQKDKAAYMWIAENYEEYQTL